MKKGNAQNDVCKCGHMRKHHRPNMNMVCGRCGCAKYKGNIKNV